MKEDTYYARNRQECLERAKQYRESHKDLYNSYYKEWYAKNRDSLYAKRKQNYKPKPRSKPKPKPKLQEPVFQHLPLFVPPPLPSNVELIDQQIIVRFD